MHHSILYSSIHVAFFVLVCCQHARKNHIQTTYTRQTYLFTNMTNIPWMSQL